MLNKKIVIFDFDGVIVNSFGAALELNQEFEPLITAKEIKKRFEGNINSYRTEEENRAFYEAYLPILMKQPTFPGILDSIKLLSENYILAIVSFALSNLIREYLENKSAVHHFAEIFGYETNKSKAERIKMVFRKYGAMAEDCIFITDTLGDLLEAEKAGVKSIAVTWGYHDESRLIKGNPIAFADGPEDLVAEINTFFEL